MSKINRIIRPLCIIIIGVISLILQYFGKGFEWIGIWGILILIGIIIIKLIWQLFKKKENQFSNNLICLLIITSFFFIARYLGTSIFIKINNLTDSQISNIKLTYIGDDLGSHTFKPIDSSISIIDLNNLKGKESKWTRINKFEYSSFILKIISNDTTSKIIDFKGYTFFRFSPIFKEIIIDKNQDGIIVGKNTP